MNFLHGETVDGGPRPSTIGEHRIAARRLRRRRPVLERPEVILGVRPEHVVIAAGRRRQACPRWSTSTSRWARTAWSGSTLAGQPALGPHRRRPRPRPRPAGPPRLRHLPAPRSSTRRPSSASDQADALGGTCSTCPDLDPRRRERASTPCRSRCPATCIPRCSPRALIPDPYHGRNEYDLRWVADRDWTALPQLRP